MTKKKMTLFEPNLGQTHETKITGQLKDTFHFAGKFTELKIDHEILCFNRYQPLLIILFAISFCSKI